MKKTLTACLVVTLLGAAGVIVHVATLDGLDGLIWSSMFEEDTVYAPGYSDASFRKVANGMSESELKSLLGDPLSLYPAYKNRGQDWTSWCYTKSQNSSHYRIRSVRIKENIVIGKHAEFYVD
jgi:hypothetical protein